MLRNTNMSCAKTKNFLTASGFTLLEVMIAIFVLSVGLLGLALLQTTGLRLNTDSHSRTQATYAAYDIIDKMRASVKGLASNADVITALNSYEISSTSAANAIISTYQGCKASTCNCASVICSASQRTTYDLGQWYEQQDRLLPGAKDAAGVTSAGRALIDVNNNTVTVTLVWMEQENQATQRRTQSWNVEIYR